MITTAALPPKAAKATCTRCGITSCHPIVVLVRDKDTDRHPSIARCSDQRACAMRVQRQKNRAKEQA